MEVFTWVTNQVGFVIGNLLNIMISACVIHVTNNHKVTFFHGSNDNSTVIYYVTQFGNYRVMVMCTPLVVKACISQHGCLNFLHPLLHLPAWVLPAILCLFNTVRTQQVQSITANKCNEWWTDCLLYRVDIEADQFTLRYVAKHIESRVSATAAAVSTAAARFPSTKCLWPARIPLSNSTRLQSGVHSAAASCL